MWSKEMAKGSAIFTDDIKPTCNELVAVLIRSTIPYGKIISINFEEALKAPGIVGKVSAKDLSSGKSWTTCFTFLTIHFTKLIVACGVCFFQSKICGVYLESTTKKFLLLKLCTIMARQVGNTVCIYAIA